LSFSALITSVFECQLLSFAKAKKGISQDISQGKEKITRPDPEKLAKEQFPEQIADDLMEPLE